MADSKEYDEIVFFLEDLKSRMKDAFHENALINTIIFAKYIDSGYQNIESYKIYPLILNTWPNILELSYQEYKNEAYPRFVVTNEIKNQVEMSLLSYSKILAVQKLMDMCKYNLLELRKISNHEYKFIVNTDGYPMERIEVEDYNYYMNKQFHIDLPKEDFSEIKRIMKKLLFVYNEKYIGYNADDKVDKFFELRGIEMASKCTGCLDFNKDALFGGIKYEDYVASIIVFIGITLKHIEFCKLHIEMHPEINMIDIIDVYHTQEDTALTLCYSLNIPIDTANKIIDVLTTNQEDLGVIKNNFNNSYPMFLKVSKTILMRLTLSFLVDPFMFLFQQLQNRFPNDWSREIDTRELLFREQLYNQISDKMGLIKIHKNINIYRDKKRITDIDAIIIDKSSKTIALFQLKWQEPFGESPSVRNSKKNNFIVASNKWIESVQLWLETSSNKEKADAFSLKSHDFENEWTYRLFVIGRYFSRFSLERSQNDNACWCNWYKFMNICESMNEICSEDYIDLLYAEVEKSYEQQKNTEFSLSRDIIRINDWTFHL